MLTVCDSDVGLTRDLHGRVRHSRAVSGHAVGTDRSCAQKSLVVLPFVFTPLGPAPYLTWTPTPPRGKGKGKA